MSDSSSLATLPSRWPSQLLRIRSTTLVRRNHVRKSAAEAAAAAKEKFQEAAPLTCYRVSKRREQEICQSLTASAPAKAGASEEIAEGKTEHDERKVLDWLKSCVGQSKEQNYHNVY